MWYTFSGNVEFLVILLNSTQLFPSNVALPRDCLFFMNSFYSLLPNPSLLSTLKLLFFLSDVVRKS